MASPGSPASVATAITSAAATRYCLPPVVITANIVYPRVLPGSPRDSRGRLLGSLEFRAALAPQTPSRAAVLGPRAKVVRSPRGVLCQLDETMGPSFATLRSTSSS